jgi:NTE family protein
MKTKKVALVLSSGGARGLAHIGVIEELLSRGYEISAVAGSSMGALIGGFHAAGELNAFKNWVTKLDMLDVFRLLDFSLKFTGFVKGDRVLNEIREIIPDRRIEELPVPFKALAVDIKNKKEVVFEKGSLYQAIRASISIPMVFSPVIKDNTVLVDGGLLNPIPSDHIDRNDNELLVVVNVNANIDYHPPTEEKIKRQEEDKNFFSLYAEKISSLLNTLSEQAKEDEELGVTDLIDHSLDLMISRISSLLIEKNPPDILVEVSQEAGDTFDFYRAKELIREGRQKAKEVIEKYEKHHR